MAKKVTDPTKIVTDNEVLRELERQGIDKDYVEFWQDYSSDYPVSKTYRVLEDNRRIAVFSNLPKITLRDTRIIPQWYRIGSRGNRYRADENLFTATLDSSGVCSVGVRAQEASWNPTLYLSGKKQSCSGPILLEIDPDNENYHHNVLEWDYGVCKRHWRLIEGLIRDRWIFAENPHAEIRIKHNLSGDLPFKLGSAWSEDPHDQPIPCEVDDDTEIVRKEALDGIQGPIYVEGSPETFNPSIDGYAYHYQAYQTWATIRGGAGTFANDSTGQWSYAAYVQAGGIQDKWTKITRGIMLLDTSALGAVIISAATFSLFGDYKDNSFTVNSFAINVVASDPASDDALIAADYATLGAVAFCDSAISYDDWDNAGYNDFVLNSAGLTAIAKTGITKLGTREAAYDLPGPGPTWESEKSVRFSFSGVLRGTGYKPKLVVTYAPFRNPRHGFVNFQDPGVL